jgi:hypothetical protein
MKAIFLALVFVSSTISTFANNVCNCKGCAGIGGPCFTGVGG